MKDHVPDLERCRKLKEMGFPQDLQFFWATDWCDAWWVVHETDLGCNDMPIAAPIATELIGEIKKILEVPTGDAEGDSMLIAHLFQNSCSVYVPTQTLRRIARHADTLPNALADLWLAKREKGEKG